MTHSHSSDHGVAAHGFAGLENQKSYTCTHVLDSGLPILRVSHDADDGAWQFLCGGLHDDPDEGRLVCVGCMVGRDPSLRELADLPLGWGADRDAADAPWDRSSNSSPGEE